MSPKTCRAELKRLVNEKVVASCWLFTSLYYNIFGTTCLLVISIFGGGSLIWLICPTTSVICLPYYVRFLTLFVVFMGG